MSSQEKPFVPFDFKIPELLENDYFRIRMLSVNDVVVILTKIIIKKRPIMSHKL